MIFSRRRAALPSDSAGATFDDRWDSIALSFQAVQQSELGQALVAKQTQLARQTRPIPLNYTQSGPLVARNRANWGNFSGAWSIGDRLAVRGN